MRVTSSQAAKLLRQLNDELRALQLKEANSCSLRTFRGRLESFEDFSAKNNTQKEYTQYTGVQRPYFFDHFF